EHAYARQFLATMRRAAEIVVDFALGDLLRREAHPEIVVEAVGVRGDPIESPTHPSAEALDLAVGCTRDRNEGDIALRQMRGHAVGMVGHVGTALAAFLPAWRQHEVLD